jgi:Domain of unknown function (DUF5666)
MKLRTCSLVVIVFGLSVAALAQDSGAAPAAGQSAGQNGAGQNANQGSGGGYGRRGGGYGGGQGGEGRMGRGTMGTVTEAAADHYTIKTDAGDVYTVHFDSNTRIMKQEAGMRGQGGGEGGGQGMGRAGGGGGAQQISASDIKVGDMIRVMGETDAAAKTVSARGVVKLDPATVQAMRDMQANFGKTWLMGKVTAIDGTKITLTGSMDSAPHTVVADENTTFRKRRDPVTLADIQVGDTVRADGAVKDGVFTATAINVGGMMGGGQPNQQPGAPGGAPQQ